MSNNSSDRPVIEFIGTIIELIISLLVLYLILGTMETIRKIIRCGWPKRLLGN